MMLSVRDALGDVVAWEQGNRARHVAETEETAGQLHQLEAALASLKQQIVAVERHQEELGRRARKLQQEAVAKSYRAIFGALTEQSMAVRDRSLAWNSVLEARERALEVLFSEGEAQVKLAEHHQFKRQVEPTLASLPDSYRVLLVKHHQEQAAELERLREDAVSSVSSDVGGELTVEIVFASDIVEDGVELLMLVLPVEDDVHSPSRKPDVQTWVMDRVVSAVGASCEVLRLPAPQLAFGGHQGLLAIETEITNTHGKLLATLTEELGRPSSRDLSQCELRLLPCPVAPDQLLPPEETHE